MTVRQFLGVVELKTKIVSVSTLALSALFVRWRTGSLDPAAFALALAAALCVDMGTTGFNSYFDWLRGGDRAEGNFERDKAILHGGADPGQTLVASLALFGAAAVLGFVLAARAGWALVPAGFVCLVVGFAYSGGPLPISSTPLGEFFAGGFLGEVLFLVGVYSQTGTIDGAAALAGIPSSCFIAAILSANNLCDAEADRRAGRRTVAVLSARRGPDGGIVAPGWPALAAFVALICAAWSSALILGERGTLPAVPPVVLAPAVAANATLLAGMFRRGFSARTKSASMSSVSLGFLAFTAALAAAYLVAGRAPAVLGLLP